MLVHERCNDVQELGSLDSYLPQGSDWNQVSLDLGLCSQATDSDFAACLMPDYRLLASEWQKGTQPISTLRTDACAGEA